MTEQQPHTPTVDELRRMYALKVPHDQRDRRNAEFDRFLAAAEQRGAERALRDAGRAWMNYVDKYHTPGKYYAGFWMKDRADALKGQVND